MSKDDIIFDEQDEQCLIRLLNENMTEASVDIEIVTEQAAPVNTAEQVASVGIVEKVPATDEHTQQVMARLRGHKN